MQPLTGAPHVDRFATPRRGGRMQPAPARGVKVGPDAERAT